MAGREFTQNTWNKFGDRNITTRKLNNYNQMSEKHIIEENYEYTVQRN